MWEITSSFKNKNTLFYKISVKDTDGLAEIFQVPFNGPKTVP